MMPAAICLAVIAVATLFYYVCCVMAPNMPDAYGPEHHHTTTEKEES